MASFAVLPDTLKQTTPIYFHHPIIASGEPHLIFRDIIPERLGRPNWYVVLGIQGDRAGATLAGFKQMLLIRRVDRRQERQVGFVEFVEFIEFVEFVEFTNETGDAVEIQWRLVEIRD
jgi:hypothetical protein